MKLHKRISNFILLALCISIGLSSPTITSAIDVSTSQITAPSDIYALQYTTITVKAQGTSGVVSGATVNVSALYGIFPSTGKSWVVGTTNESGLLSVIYKAPDTENETSTLTDTISADITSESDTAHIEHSITVHPIDFSTSSLNIDPTDVYEDHNATITIVAQGPYGIIEGATVDLSSTSGKYVETGAATQSTETDQNGKVSVLWQAPILPGGVTSLEVNISVTLSFPGKIVSKSLSQNITVYPIDFNSSTLEFSATTVNGGYSIDVTVNAIGNIGPVGNANVHLNALDGQFSNGDTTIEGVTDASGAFTTQWKAPDVDADITIDFTATLTYTNIPLIKDLTGSVTVLSVIHNITIALTANTTDATAGDFVSITVAIQNEIGESIDNASATFTATDGTFVDSGSISTTVSTSESGTATVVWDTSSISPPVGGLDYLIEVTIIKEYYNTNSSSITIHVNPQTFQLVTNSVPTPTSITQGENVTISVLVKAGNNPVEGATVQITAQAGIFASSGSAVAVSNTNATGYAVFIWVTEDMVVSTAKNYTFTIQATMPGYENSDSETITVEVQPQAEATTPTTTPTQGTNMNKQLGILLGVVGGIAILGVLSYLFMRKKPVM
ncbi:MAG: hypothetical protein ACTSYD_09185 [Candidatus Heimdallarchaeaceae archaeon]